MPSHGAGEGHDLVHVRLHQQFDHWSNDGCDYLVHVRLVSRLQAHSRTVATTGHLPHHHHAPIQPRAQASIRLGYARLGHPYSHAGTCDRSCTVAHPRHVPTRIRHG